MDKLIINPRERPYSPDIMDMQALLGRAISDLMRFQLGTGFNPNSSLVSNNVCYGLAITANAGAGLTYVTMTPGVLMQNSSTLAPTPGALDSPYRIGFNRTSMNVDLPSPGSPTWYLLEAQVEEVTTASELRDILNTITGQFQATNVDKRKEWQVNASVSTWKTGTSTQIPAPTFGDWVPICACLVQAGGTIALASDFVDMRPVASARTVDTRQGWSRTASVPVLRTNASPTALTDWTIKLAVDQAISNEDLVGYGGGLNLWVGDNSNSLNSVDPTSAAIIENGLVTAASTWYYLYLCPWYDSAPNSARQGVSHTRGVLVLSDKNPDAEGLFNGSALTLPAPFGNYTVPAYQAPCVGALRSNASNDGWDPMSGGNNVYALVDNGGYNSTYYSTAGNPLTLDQTKIPKHAKNITLRIYPVLSGSSAGIVTVELGDSGFAFGFGWAQLQYNLLASQVEDGRTITIARRNLVSSRTTVGSGTRTVDGQQGLIIGYTT